MNALSEDVNNDGNIVETSIQDSSFEDISTTSNYVIYVKDSAIKNFENTTFVNITSQVVKCHSSQIGTISRANFTNNKGCLYALRSTIGILQDSTFDRCGENTTFYGGAIRIVDSSTTIHQSVITNNKAQVGAGVSIE